MWAEIVKQAATFQSAVISGVDAEGYGFARWTGSDWDWGIPFATVRVMTTASGAVFSVNRSELGATSSFNFWVRTMAGEEASEQLDDAPDDGAFNYKLDTGGPDIRQVRVQATPDIDQRQTLAGEQA